MECIERGDLRAFLDGELAGSVRAQVEEHLASCAHCQVEMEALQANASVAQSALARLAPNAAEVPYPSWSQIRDRAEGRARRPVTLGWGLSQMFANLLGLAAGSRMRVAVSTVAAVAIVGLLSTLSPVQTMASSFLSVFRVQKFVTVQVDPTSMPKIAAPSDLGTFSNSGSAKPEQVTADQVESAVGFKAPVPGQLPAGIETKPAAISVTGAHSMTFTPDMKKVRAYLSSIGATNVNLPDNLDGAPITLQVPAGVMVMYTEKGGGARNADGTPMPAVGQKFVYVGATTSPTLNVPDGIDVEKIRTEVLKMPGLPEDLVNQLKSISDWRNTVVVPVVKGSSHEVTIQGQQGIAVTQPDGKGATLMWAKDGKVYAVSGSFSESELLAVANSIK